MAISFGISVLLPFMLRLSGLDEYMTIEELFSGVTPLAIGLVTMFLSLGALAWPVIRGIDFKTVRNDIGLVSGKPLQEILAGFATYALALPMLLVGVIIYAVLALIVQAIAGDQPEPSHPIQGAFSSGPWGILLIYLLACVAAPIVEEIMFRGVLYRYLRDLSRGLMWVLSFAMAALVSSFIFAVIHPQGILFVPVLGALAVGFCLGRERRGSLIAPIVAHSINNSVVMTLGLMLA